MSGSSVLGRRHVLTLCGGLGLTLLTGCRRGQPKPRLLTAVETLPKAWRSELPAPWQLSALQPEEAAAGVCGALTNQAVDLIATTDGWLSGCSKEQLQPIQAESLVRRLDSTALTYLNQLGDFPASHVLPVGVSPWVMLFRRGDAWQVQARDGWDVLLDPALTGRVVLPESPRFVMELAARMTSGDALPRLRRQQLILDDRQGINWLLKDKARVVVLPLQRCMRLLRQDPRLSAVLPASGAPLHWTLLLRPAETREPLPQAWVEQAWTSPLMTRLLAKGWRAPLKDFDVDEARAAGLGRWRSLLLPPRAVWSMCWSLAPLTTRQQQQLVKLWQDSAP